MMLKTNLSSNKIFELRSIFEACSQYDRKLLLQVFILYKYTVLCTVHLTPPLPDDFETYNIQ